MSEAGKGVLPEIRSRPRDPAVERACLAAGLSPLQARIIAGRVTGLAEPADRIVNPRLADLHDPSLLADIEIASSRLAHAIENKELIGILTDYDVDGITSHAILFECLTAFFGFPESRIRHYIGHRIQDGYGVSAALTDRILAADDVPDVIVTADCGSSDQMQIEKMAAAGIDVLVTDHHAIPDTGIPVSAHAVINPTRADCNFPDATVAGCMVCWLLMCEVRRRLIESAYLPTDAPKLGTLLDFVALGTVADAVSLFGSGNRAVVMHGLKVMNRLQRPCWRALAELLGRPNGYTVQDLGFQIGPRINARGRMADPAAAMRFVMAQNDDEARQHLALLDSDNLDRRETESKMLVVAKEIACQQIQQGQVMLVVYDPTFHAGVQGIVASRLVDQFGHPAVVLSPAGEPGRLSGSARSIPGLDIRQALQDLADSNPGIMYKFGGHVGAAGLSLDEARLAEFSAGLDRHVVDALALLNLTGTDLGPVLITDGSLEPGQLVAATVAELEMLAPYGREFDAPLFEGEFGLNSVRRVGSDRTHLSMELSMGSHTFRAIWFRAMEEHETALPVEQGRSFRMAYRLERDDYRGGVAIQLLVAGVEPASDKKRAQKKAPARAGA